MVLFYEPGKTPHGLPFDPFKACVAPRPIGWISTTSGTSPPVHNIAPYSQFNNLTYDPPYVMFSANQTASSHRKDTVNNAETTGFFGWSLATYDLRQAVNATAEPVSSETDEFAHAGIEKLYGNIFKDLPLVKASPIRFECKYHTTVRLPGNAPCGTVDIVIGRVVGVHIEDWALDERGRIDVSKTQPIARMGYFEYAVVNDREKQVFEMVIPTGKATGLEQETLLAAMQGRVLEYKGKVGEEKEEKGKEEGELVLGQAEQQDR